MGDGGALDAMIAGLERLGRDGLAAIAADAQAGVQAAARATAAAGTTPDGEAWPPLKDGGKPLDGVADAITVKASGPTLRIRLTGGAVYSHFGGRIPKRQVIPEDGIPPGILAAIQKSAAKVFASGVR